MMNNYFIILASGQSKRFNSNKPKKFITYKNKALFKHTLDKAIISKLFKKIILVVNDKKQIKKKYSKNVLIIKGGKERSDSSLIALKYLKKFKPKITAGYLGRYARMVSSADTGAVLK